MCLASNNDILCQTNFNLMDNEKRVMSVFKLFNELVEISHQDHKQMVELIESKKSKELEELVYKHKKRAFDKLRNYLHHKNQNIVNGFKYV